MKHLMPIPLSPRLFWGHIDLEFTRRGVQPWRIRLIDRPLHHPALLSRAGIPAGVRLAFQSNASELLMEVEPGEPRLPPGNLPWIFDLLIDGVLFQRISQPVGSCRVHFKDLPGQRRRMELYLPSGQAPLRIRNLALTAGSSVHPIRDSRPRWITYGSSITQCAGAAGPSETWPALVARHFNLNVTNLGYGGQCHLDPLIGRMIRDRPAEYLTVCLGINVNGQGSLSDRTFGPAVIGLLETLRDGHPRTPILAISPIFSQPRETVPNAVGLSLTDMRKTISEAVKQLQTAGAKNLYYRDGLKLFGPEFDPFMPDHLHPDEEGYRRLARRFIIQTKSYFNPDP